MIPRAFFYFPIFKIVAVIPIKDNLIAKGSLLIKLFWKYEATLSKYVWYLTKHLTKTCETIGHCPKTNWQGRRNWGGGQEGQLPLLPFARRGKGAQVFFWVVQWCFLGKIMRCDLECDLIKCVCFHWQVDTFIFRLFFIFKQIKSKTESQHLGNCWHSNIFLYFSSFIDIQVTKHFNNSPFTFVKNIREKLKVIRGLRLQNTFEC
jgi:hypothetical protein